MAVIHVTEAEAARDLHSLLERVSAGESLSIDCGEEIFEVTLVRRDLTQVNLIEEDDEPKPRRLSEVIAALRKDGSNATLPPGFGEAVMDGIRSHEHEFLADVWE